mmetsp:Transcript_21359/g.84951  ORF Transcript_21359/g.84951 Transcript_21359/m.84951 type:complete len:385 (+) Transcript_21359:40-1194(+)
MARRMVNLALAAWTAAVAAVWLTTQNARGSSSGSSSATSVLPCDAIAAWVPPHVDSEDEFRLVAIGDLHGDADALRAVLAAAGLIDDAGSCVFRGNEATVVVQMGDVVDRGPESEAASECLRTLQSTAPRGKNNVVRLAGNHELMWAAFDFRFAAPSETPDVRARAIAAFLREAREGTVRAAYAVGPYLFTHAGFRPAMYDRVKASLEDDDDDLSGDTAAAAATTVGPVKDASSVASALARHANAEFDRAVSACEAPPCALDGDLFSAGPDRGGRGVGGVFWTDFGVLSAAPLGGLPAGGVVQVVGHSAARCSATRTAACEPIRARADLAAVVVDAGLSVAYAANRAYLEVSRGRVVAWEMVGPRGEWRERDLTAQYCGGGSLR